jgi:hypothetical protein
MGTVYSSETFVNLYHTTQPHIAQFNIGHSYRCENLIAKWIYEALHIAMKSNKCAACPECHFRQCFATRYMFRSLILSCFPFTFSGEIGWQCSPRFDTRWDTISLPLHKQCRHLPSYKVFVKVIKNILLKYCIVFAPCKNCWVTETSKHASNNRITSVYSSLLGNGQRAIEIAQWESRDLSSAWYSWRNNRTTRDVFCAVGADVMYCDSGNIRESSVPDEETWMKWQF